MKATLALLTALLLVPLAAPPAGNLIHDAEMAGYLFGPAETVPEEFNGDYHYLGCAKTFAEANLEMMRAARSQ